jgi:hypothetical protein
MVLAASANSIDLLNAHTGVIMKSFQNIFDDNSASGKWKNALFFHIFIIIIPNKT